MSRHHRQYAQLFLMVWIAVEGIALAHQVQQTQFISTVQIAVQEGNPALLKRSQTLAMEALANIFDSWPELTGKRYEIKKVGNEIVSYLVTNQDMRVPMQRAVAMMIEQQLSGRMHAHGRLSSYVASLARPLKGSLEVVVDDSHQRILSVGAESVPLRDVLNQLKARLDRVRYSYSVPTDCADRVVDWNFGGGSPRPEPQSVETALTRIADMFHLRLEKRQRNLRRNEVTYVFSGDCPEIPAARTIPPTTLLRSQLVSDDAGPRGGYPVVQVFIPFIPMWQ